MLLKEEEIKSHLRLDDGLYSDGDFLKLLAQAYREVTYLILVKNPGGKWIKRDLMG